MECWIDPQSQPAQKALDAVGKQLQTQYERWQPKARYKQCLDPTVEEVKKLCLNLRRNAKDERVLFHYNGHGVPRPTNNGEIWVFNKNYTQYIPLNVYELQTWVGSPSIYVFDCSAAGLVVQHFKQFLQQREKEHQRMAGASDNMHPFPLKDCILLAACGVNEILPMNPNFPADIFTACLTTPVKIALRWFCSTQSILSGITPEMVDNIPGRLNDRRTPLGELNWIFTAITDTIAWNVLPQRLFQKLFRQDLLVASLFRNFLLAERIMRSVNCTPLSSPRLPQTHQHPMWQAWDLAADVCLSQLPALLKNPAHEFKQSSFFTEQLTAFEVWLEYGNHSVPKPPEQLPIVLQVLLSQTHRLRALILLGRFLDLGYWAVNQALSVGIFPYVLKLLQSPAAELRPILVFIWAKILALDKSCQLDLVKDNGHLYFLNILTGNNFPADQCALAAFVLSIICSNCNPGQSACLSSNALAVYLQHISSPDALLRKWSVLALAKLWEGFEEAKVIGIKLNAHERLCLLLTDPVPEVRAAAVHALGTFLGGPDRNDERMSIEFNIGLTLTVVTADASPLVRQELIVTLSILIMLYEATFRKVAVAVHAGEIDERPSSARDRDAAKRRADDKSPAARGSSKLTAKQARSIGSRLSSGLVSPRKQPQPQADLPETTQAAGSMLATKSLPTSPVLSPRRRSGNPAAPPPSVAAAQAAGDNSQIYDIIWKAAFSFRLDPMPEVSSAAAAIIYRILAPVPGIQVSRFLPERIAPARANSSDGTTSSHILNQPKNFLRLVGIKNVAAQRDSRSVSPAPDSGRLRGAPSREILVDTVMKPTPSTDTAEKADDQEAPPPAQSSEPAEPEFASPALPQSPFSLLSTSCSHIISADEMRTYVSLFRDHSALKTKAFSAAVFEADDGVKETKQQQINHQRHSMRVREAKLMKDKAATSKFDNQVATLGNVSDTAAHLLFHPYINIVAVADTRDSVNIWSWEEGVRIHSFSNQNPPGTRITSLKLVNEHDTPMLIVTSDDGVVRVWRGWESANTVELTSGWNSLSELATAPTHQVGLVADWNQNSGLLMAGGDASLIRVWDMERELAIQDIPTGIDAPLTTMAHDHSSNGKTVVAGVYDGTLAFIDCRTPGRAFVMNTVREHTSPVQHVAIPHSSHSIVSGASSGEVKLWDFRYTASCNTFANVQSGLSALAVHDYAPLIAIGSSQQKIKVINFSGDELSLIRYHDGFLGQRIGRVSSLAFHPFRLLLAAGAADSIVSIYESST